jgi:hypothetical protein
MKKLFIAILFLTTLAACTKNFEAENQNPYQISDELLKQDFNLVGSPFSGMMYNLFGGQIEEDLCQDSWMGHLNTPTDFVGNVNNTTYYIRWNSAWGRAYNSVMSPSRQVIRLASENDLPLFATWAKLIRILSISKLTASYGPVIYTNYGSTANDILYDSEQDLYKLFFMQLDSIQTTFAANIDYKGYSKFDPSFKGNISNWMKVVNSVRFKLAMRIVKADPDLAKAEGEKAMSDAAGLISSNADNFYISLLGNKLYLQVICFEWNDTRMGAVMESFLGGMKDPRIAKFFQPPLDASLYADHPDLPYKGIRNGSFNVTKPDHVNFSMVSEEFKGVQTKREITAAEMSFLKAEAALRGWAGAGDAKTNYEAGVRLSFENWGAGSADAYLADATSKPIDYIDPVDARNNFTASSTITVAWNESDNNELKLEKIITQKWINAFTNSLESWCDFRRTGYPKIPVVGRNASSPDWGVIPDNEWIKRMPYITAERTGNPNGVADAVTKLGGPDLISTRLWFDKIGPNF